jgi:hypothetical protein
MKLFEKRLSRFKREFFSFALIVPVLLGSVTPALAGGNDDPLLTMVMIDQLEARDADEPTPWVLNGQAWVGKDLKKPKWKTLIVI